MTLTQLLQWLLTPGGCGAAVFGLIQLVDRFWPAPGLTGNQKFYSAAGLSVLLPLAAYAGEVALGLFPFSTEGVFAAFFITYMVSQTVHRTASLQAAATPVLLTAATSLAVSGVDTPFAPLVAPVVTTAPPGASLYTAGPDRLLLATPPPPPPGVVLEEPTS